MSGKDSNKRQVPDGATQKTIQQRRMEDALMAAQKIRDAEKCHEIMKLYRSYTERIGPSILINGLGQALASELSAAGKKPESSGEKAHNRLYQNIESWLCRPRGGVYQCENRDEKNRAQLLSKMAKGSQEDYLRAQAESLAWIVWHKKFCRAFLPRETNREGDTSGSSSPI